MLALSQHQLIKSRTASNGGVALKTSSRKMLVLTWCTFSSVASNLDPISTRSPSPLLMWIPTSFQKKSFTFVSHQHCSTGTVKNACLYIALQLFPPCCSHVLWTQPLASDVVANVFVIFSCPPICVLLHDRSQLSSNSADRLFSTGPADP